MNITMISSSSSSPALVRRRSNVDLPEELMVSILAICPVKSVVRFKSVSKLWQSLISDPRFWKTHRTERSRVREDEKRFIILGKERTLSAHIYVVKEEEEYILDVSSITNPQVQEQPSFYVSNGIFRTESVLPYPSPIFNIPLCSCNGLILFTPDGSGSGNGNNNIQHYMLWNPSIRKQTIIVSAPPPRPCLHRTLYYDSTTDDHKILFSDDTCYTFYSCNEGNWSDILHFPRELITASRSPSRRGGIVCFDGCFYSLLKHTGEVVCFDSRDGSVHKFGLPNNVERVLSLCAQSGRLYLYGFVKDDDNMFSSWAMEKERQHGSSFGFEKWVMDNQGSTCVSRKLIGIENEVVADLHVEDGDSSVHAYGSYPAYHPSTHIPSHESRIFPYSENLYMHMH